MKNLAVALLTVLINVSVWGQTSVVTNQQVIDLVKVGLGTDVVIAKINSSECDFDTSTAALIKLKETGVPD